MTKYTKRRTYIQDNIQNLVSLIVKEVKLFIKPLSINEAFQGRRFKTDKYLSYEKEVLLSLPKFQLPPAPYKISYEFGFSNIAADFDNPVKLLTDIMQKKYGFNDKDVMEAYIRKVKAPKGKEFFSFLIETSDVVFK